MTVRVVVADDLAAVRASLAMILGSADGIEVVAEVDDGVSAVQRAIELRPDVVVMDIRMPGINGIEATRRLVTDGVCEVLVLTTFDIDEYVDAALAAGAAGFLIKSTSGSALIEAVRVVARGDGMLAPEVTRRVLSKLATARRQTPLPALATLTPRETDVLVRLGRGLSNAEISEELVITEATTKSHVSRVLTKLGVRSRVKAAVAAQEAGLTE